LLEGIQHTLAALNFGDYHGTLRLTLASPAIIIPEA